MINKYIDSISIVKRFCLDGSSEVSYASSMSWRNVSYFNGQKRNDDYKSKQFVRDIMTILPVRNFT